MAMVPREVTVIPIGGIVGLSTEPGRSSTNAGGSPAWSARYPWKELHSRKMARAIHSGRSGVAGADQTSVGVFVPSAVRVRAMTRESASFSWDAIVERLYSVAAPLPPRGAIAIDPGYRRAMTAAAWSRTPSTVAESAAWSEETSGFSNEIRSTAPAATGQAGAQDGAEDTTQGGFLHGHSPHSF